LEYLFDPENKKATITILDWDEINLIEDDRIKLECCGEMKAKKGESAKICGKNATYCLNTGMDEKSYGFCKTHLPQHTQYWSQTNTQMLFREITPGHKCNYLKTDGSECEKKCKYLFKHDDTKNYYCTSHYKSELKKKSKEFSPLLIKNLIVKKYPTSQLQLNLIKKLDQLSEHFAKLKIEEVVIENQPSQKNPKMKSIANTLFDYFMIRGYVDKIHEMDIQLVRFMCPSNKLKVNNDNTIEVFKANKDTTKKYKLTKALGIQYTRQLLKEDVEQLEYLDLYKKKDDICDAYLQGRYYLEFIKNKKDTEPPKKIKKIGGSKTTKKTREAEDLQRNKKIIKSKPNIHDKNEIDNHSLIITKNKNGSKKNMGKKVDVITL
jgi:hypothetical protein